MVFLNAVIIRTDPDYVIQRSIKISLKEYKSFWKYHMVQ